MYEESQRTKPRILILGAGISGLTTAYDLRDIDAQILILEARNRLGGRIDTRKVPGTDLTFELGAEWIGKDHTLTLGLCKELSVPLVGHRMQTNLLFGSKMIAYKDNRRSAKVQEIYYELTQYFSKLPPDAIANLDEIDWWNFLLTKKVTEEEMKYIDLMCYNDFGESARHISAHVAMTHLYYEEEDEYVSTHRIDGGFEKLTEALRDTIGGDAIVYNSIVDAVYNDEKGISVLCKDGKMYKADVVISTLPASVLAQVHWQPLLPKMQQLAVQATTYNMAIKSAIIFKKRFWDDDSFQLLTDSLALTIHHATKSQDGEKGVLTVSAMGEKAQLFASLKDDEKSAYVCDLLEPHFGPQKENVLGVLSHDWTVDTMVRGGYSVFRNSKKYQQIPIMQQPFRNIFFAGEHTSQMHGFIEGAVESAHRVASEVRSAMQLIATEIHALIL